MKFAKWIGAIGAMVLALGSAASAQAASVVYDLTLDGCSGGCGATPFGQVTVTDLGGGELQYVVQLLVATDWFNQSGNSKTHTTFAFDLNGNPAVTFSNFSSTDFAAGGPISNASPFGAFGYTVAYGGKATNGTPLYQTLSFDVTGAGLSLASIGSTPYNGGQVFFTSDIYSTATGSTGNVAAPGLAVPEPATWAMLIFGLGLVGVGLRRMRETQLQAA